MIISLSIIILALSWLLYETDFMRIRLPVGEALQSKSKGINTSLNGIIPPKFKPIMCKHGKTNYGDNFKCHELPARTIKAFGHTMRFTTGCNVCRAKLVRDICKVQKPKEPCDPYPTSHYTIGLAGGMNYGYEQDAGEMEISFNGKTLSVNGNYKRGMIRDFVKANK